MALVVAGASGCIQALTAFASDARQLPPVVGRMGNHLLYNFGIGGGGAGADLYGTEPWTFYAKLLASRVLT